MKPSNMTTIVGAGLCGLAIAFRLEQAGLPVTVLEANDSAGGRIKPAGELTGHQDLGPTWVWPHAQPIVTKWVETLDLNLFQQFDSGNGLFDRSSNEPATQQLLPSQHGSARIEGGTYALIQSLEQQLKAHVHCQHIVSHCRAVDQQWQLTVASAGKVETLTTDRLIIATPPRLAVRLLTSESASLSPVLEKLNSAETWMAPHAKVVIFYDNAFWREAGLSGRIASQAGPLVEVHDHCGPQGTPAALFGFSGVPANIRAKTTGKQFIDAIKSQLQRCFGEQAPAPVKILVKDWAIEPFTTTEADQNSSGAHPPVLDAIVRQPHCDDSLWFASSETSNFSAGLIEGALARADNVAQQVIAIEKQAKRE